MFVCKIGNETSKVWHTSIFLNIWNHPKHLICVFRYVQLMLFLTSKLVERQFLRTRSLWSTRCRVAFFHKYGTVHKSRDTGEGGGVTEFWKNVIGNFIVKEFYFTILCHVIYERSLSHQKIQNSSWGVEKKQFFVSIGRWWNNYFQIINFFNIFILLNI